MITLFPGKRAYVVLCLAALVDVVLLLLTNIDLSAIQLMGSLAFVLPSLLALFILKAARNADPDHNRLLAALPVDKLETLFAGAIFLQLSWIVLRVLNHLTMASGLPYVDDALISADQYLRLNWIGYFEFAYGHPVIRQLMDWSYGSLTPLSALSLLTLIAIGELKRSSFFLESFLFTAVICTTAGMFFPARAAVYAFIGGAEMFPGEINPPGLYHIEILERLRSGLPVTLDLSNLPGLVTFPSFHTAAGIILIWSFRQTWLFFPVLLYSALMISSTPVIGGHYFIDLIAGTFVAVAVLSVFQRSAEYRELFDNQLTPKPVRNGNVI